MKKKAKRIYFWNDHPEKYADNLAVCSCPMCGNPRKHFHQETLQEKRADDEYKEEIEGIQGRYPAGSGAGFENLQYVKAYWAFESPTFRQKGNIMKVILTDKDFAAAKDGEILLSADKIEVIDEHNKHRFIFTQKEDKGVHVEILPYDGKLER